MIRYKVVRQNFGHRYSCYAVGRYRLSYRKNTIITAKEGTLGIAVFERIHQAKKFIAEEWGRSYIIIRVSSIGRGKRYRFACTLQDEQNLDIFYGRHTKNLSALLKVNISEYGSLLQCPPGTIFYQQVKVLE